MDTIETIEYKGYTIQIEYDTDSNSPREWDNLGTMCLNLKGYTLVNEMNLSDEDIKDMDGDTSLIVPVYGYKLNGGLSIFTKRDEDLEVQRIGIIYASHEKIRQEYKDVPFEKALKDAKKVLEQEVVAYNQYLNGEVFAYVTLDKLGEIVDSCCEFYDMDDCIKEAKGNADYMAKVSVYITLDMVTDEGWQVRDRKYMDRRKAEELVRKNPKIYRIEEKQK